MIGWLRRLLSTRELQRRLALLISLAVFWAVALTGTAAYFITRWSVNSQLDFELQQVADVTARMLSSDIENMGGIDQSAVQAANVKVAVMRADGTAFPARADINLLSSEELAIARTGEGASARTWETGGVTYRIIAVPLHAQESSQHYSLVIARPLERTLDIFSSLLFALAFVGALAVVAAMGVGNAIARASMDPLRRLSHAVSEVTATNQLTPVPVEGGSEVADVARNFNSLLGALESSRERQRRLIADAGHELRTPLTSMRTNVELLVADQKSGMLPQGARDEILRDVAAQLGEFTTLVGDLVQLSREDAVQPHSEPIDFKEVVEAALARVKRRGGPGLAWDVDLRNSLFLTGEPDALERAVTNLLDNAVKFSPPDAAVHVTLDGDRLRVADEGPGISDADLPHVFERFYRSDKARNTPGSGLGLSIVAQTVQAHGGWVRADHAAEGGAEFLLCLPGQLTDPLESETTDAPAE